MATATLSWPFARIGSGFRTHRRHEKGNGYDRGYRTCDVKCHCGKLCTTRIGYYQHLQSKHSKELRRMKKSGEWERLEYDWPYDRKPRKADWS